MYDVYDHIIYIYIYTYLPKWFSQRLWKILPSLLEARGSQMKDNIRALLGLKCFLYSSDSEGGPPHPTDHGKVTRHQVTISLFPGQMSFAFGGNFRCVYSWCGSTPMGVLCKGIKLNKAIVGIYTSIIRIR